MVRRYGFALIAAVNAVCAVSCSSREAPNESTRASASAIQASTTGVFWQSRHDGYLKVWRLVGTTVVQEDSVVTRGCTEAGTCDSVLDTGVASVRWYDSSAGYVIDSTLHSDQSEDSLSSDGRLDWTCDDTGCAEAYYPVGNVRFQPNCPPGVFSCPVNGLLWHNPSTGEVLFWKTDGETVTGKGAVGQTCGSSDHCSDYWVALQTADFDGDGNSDILWYSKQSGELGLWMLDGSANVKSYLSLSWRCDSTCAASWKLVDAADLNSDGRADLLWFNATSGVLQTWLLDGSGHVMSNPSLSQTCDAASGCSAEWEPAGVLTYPVVSP